VQVRWKLRMTAARREVWTAAQLRRLLAEHAGLRLSSASVSALFARQPAQVKLSTLAALCTALECTPNDLFEVDTVPVTQDDPSNAAMTASTAMGASRSTTVPKAATAASRASVRGRPMPPI
jgi:putative transcriptional regulator